ncbi:hypothetical protein C8J56DRAFT_718856, partial [Mycena floridula]
PIPDFKALHSAHDAQLALRKEHIVPIVPLSKELPTEARARERAKWDQKVRERELEMEREREEQRKAREIEQEKEIRELRRKAIPRAHEVPEWYKDAPKRQ